VRETGRGNCVAVLSRDKTDVSRGGGINDRGKRMGEWYLERMTLRVGHAWIQALWTQVICWCRKSLYRFCLNWI